TSYSWTILTPTSTSLTDNGPNPATTAHSIGFTVTVSGGVPDGETVSLEDASNSNAVVPSSGNTLSTGSATLTVAAGALSAGAHNLFAVYRRALHVALPISTSYSRTILTPTSTSLTDNGPNPASTAHAIGFTVTVSGGVPNGETVALEDASNGN